MAKLSRVVLLVLLGLGLALPGTVPVRASEGLTISAGPLAGPAGTTVTVRGSGARPNAALAIGGGFRTYPEGCAGGIRGHQGNIFFFARMTADADGNFSVTFRVEPYDADSTFAYFAARYEWPERGESPELCFDVAVRSQTFDQTGKTVRGSFLRYWEEHGGLAIHGYPISDPFIETLENGKPYTVQYFERSRLELHDDMSVDPQILLGAFGRRIHPADPPVAAISGATYFAATGHNVARRAFIDYWNANGGLAQFGYPISEEFTETLDGREYRVQYFERARFEYHPENPAPYDVLLGQFGRQILAESGQR